MNSSKKGIFLTITGGIFWGISGVCGQHLFASKGISANWLVSIRLLSAGLIMCLVTLIVKSMRVAFFEIFKSKRDMLQLALFAVFGMGACQFTYFVCIEASNAATATILQFTAPAPIMLITALKARRVPSRLELLALMLTLAGVFFISTHGHIDSLAISHKAFVWGIISAFTVILYNLLPSGLMQKYGTIPVLGSAMLLGGLVLSLYTKPYIFTGVWDAEAFLFMSVIVLVGTIGAFGFYLKGVQLLGASSASLFASSEPLTSAVLTAVFMKVMFSGADILGLALLIGASLILSLEKMKNEQ